MVKAYFSREIPFYLMPMNQHSDDIFDAQVVDVDIVLLDIAVALRGTIRLMEEHFQNAAAYEEVAQNEADLFHDLLMEAING
jgi:hypothetical protein